MGAGIQSPKYQPYMNKIGSFPPPAKTCSRRLSTPLHRRDLGGAARTNAAPTHLEDHQSGEEVQLHLWRDVVVQLRPVEHDGDGQKRLDRRQWGLGLRRRFGRLHPLQCGIRGGHIVVKRQNRRLFVPMKRNSVSLSVPEERETIIVSRFSFFSLAEEWSNG